jgi:hypothetical protein
MASSCVGNDTEAASEKLYANNNDFNINDMMYPYRFVQKKIPTTYDELHRLVQADNTDNGPYLMAKAGKLIVTNHIPGVQTIAVYDGDEIGSIVSLRDHIYYISIYNGDDFYEINTVASDFYILNGNEDVIYCVYGYAHMIALEGRITRIIKVDGKWQKDESFEIDFEDEYIETFYYDYAEGDTVYVVTNKRIIKIRGDKVEKVLLEDAFWKGTLYPNSIVKIGETLYIGMRGGIASYDLGTGELCWYEMVAGDE